MATTKRQAVKRAVTKMGAGKGKSAKKSSAVKKPLKQAVKKVVKTTKSLTKKILKATKPVAKQTTKKVTKITKVAKPIPKLTAKKSTKRVTTPIVRKGAGKAVQKTSKAKSALMTKSTKSSVQKRASKPLFKKTSLAQLLNHIDAVYLQVENTYKKEMDLAARKEKNAKQVLAQGLKKQTLLADKIKKLALSAKTPSQHKLLSQLNKDFQKNSPLLAKLEKEQVDIERESASLLLAHAKLIAEQKIISEHRRAFTATPPVKKITPTTPSVSGRDLNRHVELPVKTETTLNLSLSHPQQHLQKAQTAKPILPTAPNLPLKESVSKPSHFVAHLLEPQKNVSEKTLISDVKKTETSDA